MRILLDYAPELGVVIGLIIGLLLRNSKMINRIKMNNTIKSLPNEYLTIDNMYLYDNDKKIHLIDYIVFSKYGVYVIEFRNSNNKLMGDPNNHHWEEYKGSKEIHIYNPNKTTNSHIRALKQELNSLSDKCIGLTCVPNKAILDTSSTEIVHISELLQTITKNKEEILPDYELYYDELKALKKTYYSHIDSIKKDLKNQDDSILNKYR